MLVDAINNRKPSGATETTVLGPFYVGNAPVLKNGANICLDGKGEPLVVHGKVRGVEGAPIEGVSVETRVVQPAASGCCGDGEKH